MDLFAQTSTGELHLYRHNGQTALAKVDLFAADRKIKPPIGVGRVGTDSPC